MNFKASFNNVSVGEVSEKELKSIVSNDMVDIFLNLNTNECSSFVSPGGVWFFKRIS